VRSPQSNCRDNEHWNQIEGLLDDLRLPDWRSCLNKGWIRPIGRPFRVIGLLNPVAGSSAAYRCCAPFPPTELRLSKMTLNPPATNNAPFTLRWPRSL